MQVENYIQQVGAVRDKLLNKQVKDEDYCVVGITLEQFKKLCKRARKILLSAKSRLYSVPETERKKSLLRIKN